jgi:starch phosphorylase
MNSDDVKHLIHHYGCGPVRLTGGEGALYDRRLVFDHVVAPEAAGAREQFESLAASLRDVLSQRWLKTSAKSRCREPQTGVLPVDGVSDWPIVLE